MGTDMSESELPALARLLREIGADAADGGAGAEADGEFLLDDGLHIRVRPAAEAGSEAEAACALVEVWLLDLALITGPARELLFHAIGQCNAIGAAGRPFTVGVDERDFVVLCRRLPLAGLAAEDLLAEMSYLADQGRDARSLLNQLAFGTLPA